MFAVGICRICAQPSCGTHGSVTGGIFVCNAHIAEAGRRAAAEQARRDAERKRLAQEIAREATEQRAEMIRARNEAFPEFPAEGGMTAEQLSAGLRKYASGRKLSFVIERKSLGRTKTVRGWGFAVGSEARSNAYGKRYYHHRGLIVTDNGEAYSVSEESASPKWAPGDHRHGPPPHQIDSIGARDAQIIIGRVLEWVGRPSGGATTPARAAHLEQLLKNGRISRDDAERIAPDGRISDAAWASIRDR